MDVIVRGHLISFQGHEWQHKRTAANHCLNSHPNNDGHFLLILLCGHAAG
jgi:hypothetical protein